MKYSKLLKRSFLLASLSLMSSCSQQLNNIGLSTGLGNAGHVGANIYDGGLNLGLNLGQMRIGTNIPSADLTRAQTSIGSEHVDVSTSSRE